MVANVQGTPPGGGWFPDPAGSPYLRWWDGSAWTDHFIDAATGAPPRELPMAGSSAPQATTVAQAETLVVETPVAQTPLAETPVVESPAAETRPAEIPRAETAAATPASAAPLFPVAEPTPAVLDVAASVPPAIPVVEPAPVSPTFIKPELPAAAAAAASTPAADDVPLTRRQLREQEERQSLGNFSPAVAAPEAAPIAAPAPVPPSYEPKSFEPTPFSFSPVPAAPVPATSEPAVPEPMPFTFGQTPVPTTPEPATAVPATPTDGTPDKVAQSADFPFQDTPFQDTPLQETPFPATPFQPPPAQPTSAQPTPSQPTSAQPTSAQPTPSQPTSDAAATSWPFATGLGAASANSSAGSAAPFAPSSAGSVPSSWLGAPPPQPSDAYALPGAGVASAAATAEPMTRSRQRQSEEHYGDDDGVPSSSTWAVWVFAVLPVLHFALVYLLYIATKPTDDTYRFAVLLGPIVIYLVLAVVDRSILARAGHETLPSPLLAIIPPLYLGFRVTRVGRSSLPQLITWFVLQAVMIAMLALVFPAQFSQLTSGTTAATRTVIKPAASTTITPAQRATELTPAGMQAALTKQFLAQGISLTSVTCPPLADKNDKTQVTCTGVLSTGNLAIIAAVDSALKTSAFAIVSSTPATK